MSLIELFPLGARYQVVRYPIKRFGPLALVLAAAGVIASLETPRIAAPIITVALAAGRQLPDIAVLALTTVQLFAVMLAFRIADDLADREHDRRVHPGRITLEPGVPTAMAFYAVLVLPSAVFLALIIPDGHRLLACEGLAGLLVGAWYLLAGRLRERRLLNAQVVLLKYPLFVIGAAGAPLPLPRGLMAAAIAAYVLLLIHEIRDDAEVRAALPGGSR
jgi:4-hydroxybenzoate polyprenyltransferase